MKDFYTYNYYELKDFDKCSKSRMPSAQYVYLKIGDNEELCFEHWSDIYVRLNRSRYRVNEEFRYYISFHVGNRAVQYEFLRLDIIEYITNTDYYNPFLEDNDYFIPIDNISGTCLINGKEMPFKITFLFWSDYRIFKKNSTDFKGIKLFEFYEKTNSKLELKQTYDKKYSSIHESLQNSLHRAKYKFTSSKDDYLEEFIQEDISFTSNQNTKSICINISYDDEDDI